MGLPKTGIEQLDHYCEGVKCSDIKVCHWVRKAVDRHYKDLGEWGLNHYDSDKGEFESEKKGDYYFDRQAAEYYVSFFRDNLRHYDGVFAGQRFEFEPWQWFTFASPFGWLKYKRINDMSIRRFSSMDIFIPKKQGKSAWIGGNMLFFLEWDNYPGAQIYSLALNQTQAKELGYRDAEIMALESPTLEYKIKKGAAFMGIYYEKGNAHIKPLVNDEEIADGPKIHLAANDEIKDWENKELYETLVNGTASDPMAMVANISTAGTKRESLGYERFEYIEKLLNGIVQDESSFGLIYTIDEEDKEKDDYWQDIELYKKANPNFAVTVGEDYYKKRIAAAVGSPNKIAMLRCRHLNEWVDSANGFILSEKWNRCNTGEVAWSDFHGRTCYAGLDLGEISDFSAFALLGMPNEEHKNYIVKLMYWIPKLTLKDRENAHILLPWVEEGWITTTEGNATDYDQIKDDIEAILDEGVSIDKFICDGSKAQNLPSKIGAEFGIEVAAVTQRASKMNAPIEEILKTVFDKAVELGGDPVLAWMNSNVVIKGNYNEEKRFDKGSANDKIDGMVALAMAFMPAVDEQEEPEEEYTGYGMLS